MKRTGLRTRGQPQQKEQSDASMASSSSRAYKKLAEEEDSESSTSSSSSGSVLQMSSLTGVNGVNGGSEVTVAPKDATSDDDDGDDDDSDQSDCDGDDDADDDKKRLHAKDKSKKRKDKLKQKVQDISKDLPGIILLMFLYLLQGVPLGLTGSLPYILSSRQVSYADQGTFSFAFWPFSLKLLWAPIVDSIYSKRIGRRKSWLIPVQYAIGIFMICFATYTKQLLEGHAANSIYILTSIFFMFTFLAATQDIVVDGWALTMLSKENVGWASTCNSVGQTAGWFIGNVIFLTIESADFSNKYLRPLLGLETQTYGLVPIDKFMYFFGMVFIVSTTIVFFLKREVDEEAAASAAAAASTSSPNKKAKKSFEETLSVSQTYKLMWQLLWLAPVKQIIVILMTVRIGFAAESMTLLKLIESGVPREKLGLLAVPLTPLQIVLPLVISRYTNGPRPFDFYIRAIPFRLATGIVTAIWVYVTPSFRDAQGDYPLYYYCICLLINAVHSIFTYSMFVSLMSFFAKVSDKKIGGTYMTFLNTVTNMGGNWPTTSALYIAGLITVKFCAVSRSLLNVATNTTATAAAAAANATIASALNTTVIGWIEANKCSNETESADCKRFGGECNTKVDAFYIEMAVCTVIGVAWLLIFSKIMYRLQAMPRKAWKLSNLNNIK